MTTEIFRTLIKAWEADAQQCRESAADYEKSGNFNLSVQLKGQASQLQRCANQLNNGINGIDLNTGITLE